MNQTFELHTVVRFADCDSAGIHFFPRYLERVNQTVEEWFEGPLNRSFRTLHLEEGFSVPTAALSATFHAPSRLEDALAYRLDIERLGHASAALRTRICGGEQLRAEIRHTIVFADLATLKSRPWPDDLRARMEAYVA